MRGPHHHHRRDGRDRHRNGFAWTVGACRRRAHHIELSPASGPVGTVVTINGTGFVVKEHRPVQRHDRRSDGGECGGHGAHHVGALRRDQRDHHGHRPDHRSDVGLPNSPFTVTRGIFPNPRNVWAGEA